MLSSLSSWVFGLISQVLQPQDDPELLPTIITAKEKIRSEYHDIRDTIVSMSRQCNLSLNPTTYDVAFHNACCYEARRKGYPMESYPGIPSLLPFIPGGVVMAITAYAHLEDDRTRIFIALYTAFLIYLDDAFQNDIECVGSFNARYISKQPQLDPVLNSFASLLDELPSLYNRVVSNIMVTSTLNLVTALLLEHETQDMKLSSYAHGYPTFSRVMSGASETYALFAFPRDIPIKCYIQAMPELMMFINNGNDVLSFYKEDIAGESVNRVSTTARCLDLPKIEVLRRLADDAASCHAHVLRILDPFIEVKDVFLKFSQGYVRFHTSLARYRLKELLQYQFNS